MKNLSLLIVSLIFSAGLCRAAEPSPFAGKWKLDPKQSSSVKPWESITLEIAVNGDTVELARNLSWNTEKKASELIVTKTDGKTVTGTPLKYWVDTWYNNAYIGGDHQQHAKGEWLDNGRILKLEIDLALELQQGDYPVHIYREYRLSTDKNTLKVYELRSTRDQPLTFIYTRA